MLTVHRDCPTNADGWDVFTVGINIHMRIDATDESGETPPGESLSFVVLDQPNLHDEIIDSVSPDGLWCVDQCSRQC